jgi:hypothetical protein
MACNRNIILTPVIYGDTWDGLSDISFTSDGTAFASELASVRMFFKDSEGTTGLELSSANSNITITSAASWEFDVDAITNMPLAAGTWFWSIETTDAQNVRKTRIGGTLEVLDDATR